LLLLFLEFNLADLVELTECDEPLGMLRPALKLLVLPLERMLRRLALLLVEARLLMLDVELMLDGAALVRY
jgi:hypothetical protein